MFKLKFKFRWLRLEVVGVVGLAASAAAVWACGPEWRLLLWDRAQALHSTIVSDFAGQSVALVTAPDKKLPVKPKEHSWEPVDNAKERDEAERRGLSAADAAKLAAMRKAADGDRAYALGAGLPEVLRLYTAAAVDYFGGVCSEGDEEADQRDADEDPPPQEPAPAASSALAASSAGISAPVASSAESPATSASTAGPALLPRMQPHDPRFARMEQRFKAVLALPAAQGSARAAWAAYSLGRAHAVHCRTDEAMQYFQLTRKLVKEGADDPLFLAVASLGEEAQVEWGMGQVGPAVALYAEQAARGALSGRNSLKQVAGQLLQDEGLLREWIGDPLVQRLVLRYAVAGEGELPFELAAPTSTPQAASPALRLLNLLGQLPASQVQEPDVLAALAYNHGRDQLARTWAQGQETAMAHWVLAKLELRAGRQAQAAEQYALAVRLMQQRGAGSLPAQAAYAVDGEVQSTQADVLQAEQGVMSLTRGDFVQALTQLYAVGHLYWMDLAYVADRVVTTDELKAFVDAHVPQPPLPKITREGDRDVAEREPGVAWPVRNVAAQMRHLLARRLMREHRYEQALAYFPQPGDLRFNDPAAREHAQAYADAVTAAPKAWTWWGRAQAYYTAATLMRQYGMELVGYELGPDFTAVRGIYSFDSPSPAKTQLATAAERTRFAATAPPRDVRYHYRVRAAELAAQAADALPPRSQAYAASLCAATGWLLSVDDREGARALYQRYVHHGAQVDFATHFGRQCPQPSFRSAVWLQARRNVQQGVHHARLLARQHKPATYGVIVLAAGAMVAGAWWGVQRNRSRSA